MEWAESDDLEPEPETGPNRRCIVSALVRPKGELLRFVVSPTDEVVPDLEQRLPGRGIWLSARRDVVNTAVAKRLFAKAARRKVVAPEDLADRIEAMLLRRCLDILGLARRAGHAVTGFEKVKAELKAGRVMALVEARDAAEDGKGKLRALARGVTGENAGDSGGLPVVELFDAVELGTPFGRDQAVHVALAPGGLARRLIEEAGLLAGFRVSLVSASSPEAIARGPGTSERS
ncbi:MAG: RNA-binding protein [Rhodospirillaceae bacterium]|nr:RNA-binding protein [Rhodospirillales bacterium]